MFKKSLSLLVALCSMSLLAACNQTNIPEEPTLEDSTFVMPKNAPTLPMYKFVLNETGTPTVATDIPTFLSNGVYDYVVFDSGKAQSILDRQGENAKYVFVKMLTGGNFHLLGFNKNEGDRPVESENVYGFSESTTPGQLYRKIYGADQKFDVSFDEVALLKDKLLTMTADYKIDGTVLDWAVVAEPVCTAVKNALKNKHGEEFKIYDIEMSPLLKTVTEWDKDYICQAGLFAKKELALAQTGSVENLRFLRDMELVKESVNMTITAPAQVKAEIYAKYETSEVATNHFGFNPDVIPGVQGADGKKNGFGIVPNDVEFTADDIRLFNSLVA